MLLNKLFVTRGRPFCLEVSTLTLSSRPIRVMIIIFSAIGFLWLFPSAASAHLLIIEQKEAGTMMVRYDDGTPATLATVTLYDQEGNVLSEGSVNSEGFYRYDPIKPVYRVVADDGMGHRARWVIGSENWWLEIPRWARALLGVSILLFIAAFLNYRKTAAQRG